MCGYNFDPHEGQITNHKIHMKKRFPWTQGSFGRQNSDEGLKASGSKARRTSQIIAGVPFKCSNFLNVLRNLRVMGALHVVEVLATLPSNKLTIDWSYGWKLMEGHSDAEGIYSIIVQRNIPLQD